MTIRKLVIPIATLALIAVLPYLVHPVLAQTSQNVISQLESDINDAKNTANNAAQSYSRVAQSFQEVKNSIDMLYMVSLTGIGIGIAGVVIAVMAITRNKQH
jgi:methionyl-tRNA synthetase